MRSNVSAAINQTHPFSETRRMCACVRERASGRVYVHPARQRDTIAWLVAGVWLEWSYAGVVGRCADPSLSVSQEPSSIMKEWESGPERPLLPLLSPPTALAPRRSANPDLNGRITVRMMSGLKNHRSESMPHNSSGSPRAVSVDMGELIV